MQSSSRNGRSIGSAPTRAAGPALTRFGSSRAKITELGGHRLRSSLWAVDGGKESRPAGKSSQPLARAAPVVGCACKSSTAPGGLTHAGRPFVPNACLPLHQQRSIALKSIFRQHRRCISYCPSVRPAWSWRRDACRPCMSRVTNLNSDDHVRLSAGMSGMKIKMIITDYRKSYLSFFIGI